MEAVYFGLQAGDVERLDQPRPLSRTCGDDVAPADQQSRSGERCQGDETDTQVSDMRLPSRADDGFCTRIRYQYRYLRNQRLVTQITFLRLTPPDDSATATTSDEHRRR